MTPAEITTLSLSQWIHALNSCGVDLDAYGWKEIDLYQQGRVLWRLLGPYQMPDGLVVDVIWVLKDLYYGKSPSDWGFYVEAEIEDRAMPGAWVEDESSSKGDSDQGGLPENGSDPGEQQDEEENLDSDTGEKWEEDEDEDFERTGKTRIVDTITFEGDPAGSLDSIGKCIRVLPCDLSDPRKKIKYIYL